MGVAISWFTANGYTVAIPLTDSQRYDLIVEDDSGELRKVQVKTTTRRSGRHFIVTLATSGGNRSGYSKRKTITASDVDLVFALAADGAMYLIPSPEVEGKVTYCLGHEAQEWRLPGSGAPVERLERATKVTALKARPTKIEWPTIERLVAELESNTLVAVAQRLGVSDSAVRKHLDRAGVLTDRPRRPVRHGTEYGYRKGCRCPECRTAVREATARRKAA